MYQNFVCAAGSDQGFRALNKKAAAAAGGGLFVGNNLYLCFGGSMYVT